MITTEERHQLMQSEARFDRKRGMHAILLSQVKKGTRYRYFIERRNFWKKLTSLEYYNMMRGIYELK